MTTTQAPIPANYEQVVQTIREWPPQAQADLAQTIIRLLARTSTIQTQANAEPSLLSIDEPRDRGAILEWIRTRPTTGLPPPTDEEIAQWIDEYRMERYG